MTQTLVTIGFGPSASIAGVVLLGFTAAPGPDPDPTPPDGGSDVTVLGMDIY